MRFAVALLGIVGCCGAAFAQSNPPPTHAELYARVKDVSIHQATQKSATGAPLTTEQLADLEKATKSQERAESLSDEGKYLEAATAAKEAMRIRASILGSPNYLTVSSVALAAVSDQAAAMAPDAQAEYAAADKALRDWNALNEEGHYEQAKEKATFALEYAKRRLNETHPMMALAYLRLGTTQIDLGEYSAALESIEKAKTLTKAIYGATHPKYAAVMDRLGWVNIYLAGQGVETKARVDTALESLQTAVQIYRSTVGEVGETAESLDNLGTAMAYAGRVREAIDTKLRALFIRETVLGPEARDTGVSLSNLAWLYGRLGMTSEVLPLRERALAIFRKLLRPDHPYIYLESANVGWDYHLSGRDEEAIQLFESLVEQDKARKDKVRPDVVQRLSRLAEVNAAARRYAAAHEVMERAFADIKTLYGSEYSEQAIDTLAGMARAATRARMFEDASKYYALVCEWSADSKNRVSADERVIYEKSLGATLLELGRIKEAKRILSDCVTQIESDSTVNRLQMIEPLIYLSRIETELKDNAAATKHADRAVQIAESNTSAKDFTTAFPQLWLGRAFSHAGNYAMAEFCLKEAKSTFDRLEDRDPTGALLVRVELANTLVSESKSDDALKLLNEALTKCRDLRKTVTNPYLDAMQARVLRTLWEATKSGGASSDQRGEWKRECVEMLKALSADNLLNADEKAWLAANG